MSSIAYSAAVVTYRRVDSLKGVLDSIASQVPPPKLTVVADNDPDGSARPLVEGWRDSWPGALEYVAVGDNLGPAGGWARAVSHAQGRDGDRGEWVLVVDDDDPLGSPRVVGSLLTEAAGGQPRLAGVGLRGARLLRSRGLLRRVEPDEGTSAPVDFLPSNGAPLYRWTAIDEVGFFEPRLFFGFEDLDLGLRLTAAGWELRAAPRPSLHVVADTASTRTAWREYYKNRALVWILRRRVGRAAVLSAILRSTVLGSLRLVGSGGRFDLAQARWRGSVDGLGGRLGRIRYHPGENPPKPPVRGGSG